ncbi:CPBP family intramembrane glutamic endopeptidase [Nocardioides ungokensis]|uniref:CPBP family intramembrane glutamic endopeptidase n=1 Tax=Nocardioides ungokensis TaxID=1643322 RepID=UPI001C608756|nr:CPBP family intramembrane glutamic endopeptidase [Nocardioides ungokensis]
MAVEVLGWTVAWTLLELALVIPVAEHLTGRRQDVSEFAELQGNLGLTLALIGLSWTLAAVGEEVAYRGYLLTRMREALPAGNLGVVTAVLASAVLFGMAHTEQGVVGVLVTAADAVVFTALRYRYRTLWASVLAHGYNNTIGLTAYFLVGPIHGLW